MKFTGKQLVFCALSAMIAGCGYHQESRITQNSGTITRAIAVLSPTKGNIVRGTVTFTRIDDGIRVVADLTGLSPGRHGIHIHEFGDCSAEDASSAGDHFNPSGEPHGAPTTTKHHAGDFGNIEARSDGTAHLEMTSTDIAFSGKNSIIGHAVVIHAGADDFTSQPSGNSGVRIACGVIGTSTQKQ